MFPSRQKRTLTIKIVIACKRLQRQTTWTNHLHLVDSWVTGDRIVAEIGRNELTVFGTDTPLVLTYHLSFLYSSTRHTPSPRFFFPHPVRCARPKKDDMILTEAEDAAVNEAKLVLCLLTFGSTKHVLPVESKPVEAEAFVRLTMCN